MQLLERASQLELLNSALNGVKAGAGRVALVYGEAGIGKTSLVEHFAKQNEKSWRVLSGACDLLFTPRPLGPLGDIALQTEGPLLKLLDAGSSRDALFPACLKELKECPTILVIEDIHWADEATLDLLKFLGRRIRQTACLMVLTYRDDEVGADSPLRLLLGDLVSSHAVQRVPVPALTLAAVRELVKQHGPDAAALHRLTNGNPFFLTEVLAGQGGVPQTVRDAMLARAARLSPMARGALDAAAVAGLHVEDWLLAAMIPADDRGIEECVSKGLLQQQGDGYAFRHELARQTILEAISASRRRELNRKALAALRGRAETRDDLARLATHAEGTGDAEAVLQYAPAAAREAARAGAHRQAVALYELALRFADALPPIQHVQMLETYADELCFLGDKNARVPVRREIIKSYRVLGDFVREGRNLAMLAPELHGIGHAAEAKEASRAAVAMLEAAPPGPELAQAYRQQCYLLQMETEYIGGVAAGEKAIALAERFGDMGALSMACNMTGQPMLCMGDERGRALMERSLAVAREHGLQYAIGLALAQWANALVWTFEFEEASRLVQDCIAYTTEHDDDIHLSGMPINQAEIKMYQGHWAEALEILEQAEQHPWFRFDHIDALRVRGRIGVRRGDSEAQESLRAALTACTEADVLEVVSRIHAGLAEAAWLAGDHQRASEEARAVYHLFASQHITWNLGELALWRWRAGDEFTPPDWIAKPYRLQIAGDWRGAAEEWEKRGCPYEQGMALMDGDRDAQLRALEIFGQLGARPICEVLKRKMRIEGVRGIPRGPRPATRENQWGLTTREMEVLACILNGCSNSTIARQLSLSVRTVEHHITSMLQKTGAQSRSELVGLILKENAPTAS